MPGVSCLAYIKSSLQFGACNTGVACCKPPLVPAPLHTWQRHTMEEERLLTAIDSMHACACRPPHASTHVMFTSLLASERVLIENALRSGCPVEQPLPAQQSRSLQHLKTQRKALWTSTMSWKMIRATPSQTR